MASLSTYDYERIQNDAWLDAHENSEVCPYCHNAVYQGNWRKHMAIKHSTIADPMTYDETRSLATHEAVITAGLDMFYAVGKALATIHEQRLYRATHGSFKAYCAERWSMSRQRGYQLMKAAGVVDLVSTTVDTPPKEIVANLITSEAQAREIGKHEPDVQKAVATVLKTVSKELNIPNDAKLAKSVGNAVSTIIRTGTVENGNGEQIEVSKVFEAQVVAEVAESMKRHTQYVHDGIAKKEARLAAQSSDKPYTPPPPVASEPTAAISPSFSIEQRGGVYVAVMVIGEFETFTAAEKAINQIKDQLAKDC